MTILRDLTCKHAAFCRTNSGKGLLNYGNNEYFVRVHWIKQRHTRRVLRDGKPRQEIVTERITLLQDGDEPPAELQEKIDKLAADFRDYDITSDVKLPM